MKIKILLVTILLAALLPACAPQAGFTGTWTANVGIVTLKQNGDEVTGSVEGYGGQWNFPVSGVISGTILTFTGETPLGSLAIVLSADSKTFKSADPATAFCGTRDSILPAGCGFSGNWNLKSDLVPAGSVAKLTQAGAKVTGSVVGPDGATLTPLNATVSWGKGWQAVGANDLGEFVLSMTADEKAFELAWAAPPGGEWCGLREGETSAYVMYFTCTIP